MPRCLPAACLVLAGAVYAGAADDALGKLSEKYESGGRGPGTVSTGKGDPGGPSFGSYQLSTNSGNADRFVQKYYPDEFKGLKAKSEDDKDRKAFAAKWKELAAKDPKALHVNEHAFIKETHYDPQAKKLEKELKLDAAKRSAAFRDVVWSVAVQHGPNTDVIATAVKPLLKDAKVEDVTDEAIVRAVYAERGRKDKDGKLVHFKKVSDDWIPGLTKRFEGELKDALEMLKK